MTARSRRVSTSLVASLTGAALLALPQAFSVPASAATAAAPHYMVIVEENQGSTAVLGSTSAPYINGLAATYASATNWYAIQHNSPADYLGLISGSTQGWGTGTTTPPFAGSTVVDELAARGIDWRAYMEDAPSPCYTGNTSGNYSNIHNPFLDFSSILSKPAQCNRVVPFAGNFVSDLNSASPPPFMWVTPNQCHDMHTVCAPSTDPILQGDQWLSTYLPTVLSSSWYASGGVVVLTWDEGGDNLGWNGGDGGHVATLVISARSHGAFTAGGNHYGTLRAIAEAYGVGLLGASANPANGDLSGAAPAPPHTGSAGLSLVTQVYSDLLGRAPDAGGLLYWSGLIDSGQPRFPVALSLTASTEYVGDQVQAQYQTYLHRVTDGTLTSGGEGFWVNYIASGATFEQLAESLIGSDEYFTVRGHGDASTYVTTLYQDILGRGPDAGGLSYWVGRLSAGAPRFQVSASILESTEGRQMLVDRTYQSLLRHLPDGPGLAFWTAQLQSGLRDETLIASIIGSDEYLQYAVTHSVL
ncbi:MAG TPA: DUF4214 domain-containing protein [Candidatus Dormibacteraeota bacterium]